ncbi:MAG: 3-phosphoshikimate 1-carboxyvinyltransferase [Legionellaceae bacterium]|nr:3-phosphoshikimate 1-carboxyvinyltransferase [Legionellaceae bacterium]
MTKSAPVITSIRGDIGVPGDKSISHRALMLAAITQGVTQIKHCLHADDCIATAHALRQMGVRVDVHEDKTIVYGVGLRGLSAPERPLDCGNSGTSMRLLSGILVGQAFDSVLIGDASLSKRPMLRIVDPLRRMGADIKAKEGHAPLHIKGSKKLNSMLYESPIASAQVKSCILFAGLYASGQTHVTEQVITRDHTERMLPFFFSNVRETGVLEVPGDLSSAAFFVVLASLVPGSNLIIRGVGVNSTRMGVIEILKAMGADIRIERLRLYSAEPVADIRVRYAQLKGIDISKAMLVRAIDEFPIILIAAAKALGQTRIMGVSELRHKESDRVQAMADGLKALGVSVVMKQETAKESVMIEGGELQGGIVDAFSDHRIAMAFLIAGAVAKSPIQVLNTSAISTSFPTFIHLANQLGCAIVE